MQNVSSNSQIEKTVEIANKDLNVETVIAFFFFTLSDNSWFDDFPRVRLRPVSSLQAPSCDFWRFSLKSKRIVKLNLLYLQFEK